ncbi:MAG: cupin domain-containing protein [Pseudomonadota bacterium]
MNDRPARPAATASIQIDAPHVRVTEYRFPPGTATGFHTHEFDYVVVPIVPGFLTMEEADGTRTQAELVFGQSYARPKGVTHDVINETTAEVAFVEIELKR